MGDSNPRMLLHINSFQDCRNRPLCQLSTAKVEIKRRCTNYIPKQSFNSLIMNMIFSAKFAYPGFSGVFYRKCNQSIEALDATKIVRSGQVNLNILLLEPLRYTLLSCGVISVNAGDSLIPFLLQYNKSILRYPLLSNNV